MSTASIVSRAFEVFHTDAATTPPLTLRGANAVDGYDQPMPFNPAEDEPDRHVPRRVRLGGGYLCGDAHTVVAVNVTPLHVRSLTDSVRARILDSFEIM
jgi:hypothetical protein